jgi:hypothetical protein
MIRRWQMDIQKIKGIAFDLIEDNQTNFTCDDSEKKYLYILAYNDGISALVRDIERELKTEAADGTGNS